jgi:integration host factor subunit beta
MNKIELIATLKKETEITKSEAAKIVEIFFNEMSEALSKGDRVELRGLCTLLC